MFWFGEVLWFYIYIFRLDIASPLHLDGSLVAFNICFSTEFAFNVATPIARTPRHRANRSAAS